MRTLPRILLGLVVLASVGSAGTVTGWDPARDAVWKVQGEEPAPTFPCYDPWTDIRGVEVTSDADRVTAVLTLERFDTFECGPGVGVAEAGDRRWSIALLDRGNALDLIMRDDCVLLAWQGPIIVQSTCLPYAAEQDGKLWRWEVPLRGTVPLDGGGTRSYTLAGRLYEPFSTARDALVGTGDGISFTGALEDLNFGPLVPL
ncbi:MAG TPA: hypothetical protein VI997_08585 [Candidatus Thermoplasmatota archaeon]|nr:hypothetical protein [Candidatus Thermoplasmatota archaeon]